MKNDNTYFIRKNQTDVMAGIDYSLGCSLVHFAMAVTICCVKWPDLEYASQHDEEFNHSN